MMLYSRGRAGDPGLLTVERMLALLQPSAKIGKKVAKAIFCLDNCGRHSTIIGEIYATLPAGERARTLDRAAASAVAAA